MKFETLKKANLDARKLGVIDPAEFALKNENKWDADYLKLVLTQYQFLDKLRAKLPEWAENTEILGADNINIEQSSSELTALHKFKKYEGKHAADLTGGFGLDSYFLAQRFGHVTYCEPNKSLFEIVKHNFKALGIENITFLCCSAEEFVAQNSQKYDLIYLDPDRRSEKNNKLVLIEDCQPNLQEIQDSLLEISDTILVKYSPLLDIKLGLQVLKNVKAVSVVAVKNDVKELLFELSKGPESKDTIIETFNFGSDTTEEFHFTAAAEEKSFVTYEMPEKFLYEPNAAIMKSGAFKSIGERFGLAKIARHSHFYTSAKLIPGFPGRILKIIETTSATGKALKKWKNAKVNVVSRNYPQKPETLRQKYRLKDGGDEFLIFTTNYKNEKILITCTRNF